MSHPDLQDEQPAREKEWAEKVAIQADAMEDGWIELDVPPLQDHYLEEWGDKPLRFQEPFKVRLPKAPVYAYASGAIMPSDTWNFVCPSGVKMGMDSRYHSDWWVCTGVPLQYSYCEYHRMALPRGYHDYDLQNDLNEMWMKAVRINMAMDEFRMEFQGLKSKSTAFLNRPNKGFRLDGRIYHVPTVDAIPQFLDHIDTWQNPTRFGGPVWHIAVVPHCGVEFDPVIRKAKAIITQVGSKAAHLVKVAREDDIPVLQCHDAFLLYPQWIELTITDRYIG